MATVAAFGALEWLGVAAVGASVSGAVSAGKARREQKRANEQANRARTLQARRGAVEQVRQAQIARSSVVQQGENQGVGGSSAVLGGAGAIKSQAGGNIGFANQVFGLQNSIHRLQQSALGFQGQSQAFGSLANLASAGMGMVGGMSGKPSTDFAAQHTSIANVKGVF